MCPDLEATAVVAEAIAPLLRTGDVLLLVGDLAAGKTSFVQAMVQSLGSSSRVASPTFGIANFYSTLAGTFLHIDAYRLSGVGEYRDLALADYAAESITAVEWGDKIETEFNEPLSIKFDFIESHDSSRRLTLTSRGDRWASDLQLLRARLSSMLTS